MTRKYYGYFMYNGEEYVIRFKIKGSLQYDKRGRCFEDKDWYVRSIDDVVAMAAFDTHPLNLRHRFFAMLLTHDAFVSARANGVKRWSPRREVIEWD